MDETASVSCVDSTSSGYQVILLQDNDPYNLTVVNVRPAEKQTVLVVPSGRYCFLELPMGDNFDSGIRYTREFIAATPHVVDRNIITSKTYRGEMTSGQLLLAEGRVTGEGVGG